MGGFVLGGCEIGQELREDLEVALFVPGTGFVPPGCVCLMGFLGIICRVCPLSEFRKEIVLGVDAELKNKQTRICHKTTKKTKIKQKPIITYKPRPKKTHLCYRSLSFFSFLGQHSKTSYLKTLTAFMASFKTVLKISSRL